MSLKPEVKKLWTDALRSGKYEQCTGQLTEIREDGSKAHCCLGVLTVVAIENGLDLKIQDRGSSTAYGTEDWDNEGVAEFCLHEKVSKWAGFGGEDPNPAIGQFPASHYNDHLDKTFLEIADLIDEHL